MNKTSNYELSIIVPVYNEEDNLDRVEKELSAFLPKAIVKSCVLFVNDGSKDSSLKKIEAICDRHSDFFYISSDDNHGLSTAMKAGIDTIESKYTGYIDSDLQTDPEDFNLLLKYAPDYQLVSGIRAKRKDSVFKKLQSKIANGFRRQDDRRHRHRHRLSSEGHVEFLRQKASVLRRHAPFPSCPHAS